MTNYNETCITKVTATITSLLGTDAPNDMNIIHLYSFLPRLDKR